MRLAARFLSVAVAALILIGCIPRSEMPHVTATATFQVGEATDMGFVVLSVAEDRTTTLRLDTGETLAGRPGETLAPIRGRSPRLVSASHRKQEATFRWIVH
jgi:hypothetical protein